MYISDIPGQGKLHAHPNAYKRPQYLVN